MQRMNGKIVGVLFIAIVAVIAMISIPSGESLPTGVSTKTAAAGCSCHDVDPTSGVIVTISTPENFTAGESYNITYRRTYLNTIQIFPTVKAYI